MAKKATKKTAKRNPLGSNLATAATVRAEDGLLGSSANPSRQAGKASSKVSQQTSKTDKPAPVTAARVKATYYLDPHELELLEDERHRRRRRGERIDVSALVREAIRLAYGA